MKRLLLVTGALLGAVFALSACNPSPATPTPTQPPAAVTASPIPPTPSSTFTPISTIGVQAQALRGLEVQLWHAFSGEDYAVLLRQVAVFNSVNEWGITLIPTAFGDYPSLFAAVNEALDSGTAPALVATLPEQTLFWHAAAAVVDLTPYLHDPVYGLRAEELSRFPAAFLAQDNLDGLQLGMPAERSARLLFYNFSWARELGFTSPPATPQEFRAQACAANASFLKDQDVRNDGYGGWIVDTHWQTSYSWLRAFGGTVTDETDYTFSTDPNLQALQFLKKLYDDHCAWLSLDPTPLDSFAKRSALFISGDLAEVASIRQAMGRFNNADEWTALPFPGSDGDVLVVYGPSYSLLQSTPEQQLAAWLFVRWVLSAVNQAQWVESAGFFPLVSSEMELIAQYRAASPQWEAVVADLDEAQGVPQRSSWRRVRYLLEDGTAVIFQTNTPLDQIASILGRMDSMAQEFK